MILTSILIGIFVIGIILLIIINVAERKRSNKVWRTIYYSDFLGIWGVILTVIGGIGVSFALMIIIEGHIGINNTIQQDNIRYESLCERLEIINSDYEDVSKSEVIKDITEWNTDVINNQYWAKNPWTNWFYSQKRINNLKLIEY